MTKKWTSTLAVLSYALLSPPSWAKSQLLQVEILPQQNGRKAPIFLEEEVSPQKSVGLSQVWKNLHLQLDSHFVRQLLKHVGHDSFLRLLQDEDFSNTSLPLLSSALRSQKGVQQTFDQHPQLMADLSGLENFIQQQSSERQLSLIIQWRSLILERVMDHLRFENAKPKWVTGAAALSVGYDSNLNRIPESISAPSQHEGKSDVQSLGMIQLKLKPRQKYKKLEATTGLTAFYLQNQDYSEHDLWGASISPSLGTTLNNDFIHKMSLSAPVGIIEFPNEPSFTQRLFHYGLRANFTMMPLDLNLEDWGDIQWQWAISKTQNKASSQNVQHLDRQATQIALTWTISLPKAWSMTSSHHYDLQKGEQTYLSRKQWLNKFTLKHAIPKHWIQQAHASFGFQLTENLYPEYFGGTQKELQQQWKISLTKSFSKLTTTIDAVQGQKTQTLDPDFLPALQQNISYQKIQVRFQYAF